VARISHPTGSVVRTRFQRYGTGQFVKSDSEVFGVPLSMPDGDRTLVELDKTEVDGTQPEVSVSCAWRPKVEHVSRPFIDAGHMTFSLVKALY